MAKKTNITRRDFMNGTAITVGAAITASVLQACGVRPEEAGLETPTKNAFSLPDDYYPPTKTGMRGSHDGSWEVMHDRVMGETWAKQEPHEAYDLVVVGAGMSGLSAAYMYRQKKPGARILVLDNHDDFGGHAKRNEFDVDGETRLTYGGTEAIDTPSGYAEPAKKLLKDIGIDVQKFYDYWDDGFYERYPLKKAIMFNKVYFGEDKLVPGYGARDWADYAADTPMSDKAKADFIRVQTEKVDYLEGKSFEEKYAILSKTSYEDYLRDYCKVDEEVINIYKRWGMSFWCVGIDEVPATLIQNYDGGMPGLEHTMPRTGDRNNEPYIFHFPDGNASIARLIVRGLIPEAMPGSTMEDVVLAKADYSKLDRDGQDVNIRLNSTVVNAAHTEDKSAVDVTYVRDGKPYTVRGGHVIMACYNMAIPYLVDDLPEAQVEALSYGVKIPLVYTKVMLRNWKPFREVGTDFIYYTGGFYKQAEFAYPVSIGDYTKSETPDDPMVIHMCHVPWVEDVKGKEQWRVGRQRILTTPYETFEGHVIEQLTQALGDYGFDAERDIAGITVNRWPHGYAYSSKLMWEPDYESEEDKPWVKGRKPFGRIHIANSDAAAKADTGDAIEQAHRAVMEILG